MLMQVSFRWEVAKVSHTMTLRKVSELASREPDFDLRTLIAELNVVHQKEVARGIVQNRELHFLREVFDVIARGGSAVLASQLGTAALRTASKYPSKLFDQLDELWQQYASRVNDHGLGLLVPPVTAIVLSRCARREAIPVVVRDLRDEWARGRRKVWDLLLALRSARTLGDAKEIEKNLDDASQLFAPERTRHDSHPVRVIWEIATSALMGAGVASLTGTRPTIGAATGLISHIPRSVPALLDEFGPALFGRGAFDLARSVRRATSDVEFMALRRLLTDPEKKSLGL
jgi:hypothetical protein